ncbi:MAG: cupin domain-containing protein [Limisphaerales bacterium]
MSDSLPAWRFVSFSEAEVEKLHGRTHFWHCKPGMVQDTDLLLVRVKMEPGMAHRFHVHPKMEEILYILSGTAEQWVEQEKKILKAGDSLYLPANVVHATFNVGDEPLEFLAILTPAKSEGPATIELGDQEPWKSLR